MKLEKLKKNMVDAYHSEFTHIVARSFVVILVLVAITLALSYYFPLH